MNTLKSLFFLLFFCFCIFQSIGQQLHTPDEVKQYMKNSAIQYHQVSVTVKSQPISLPLVESGYYSVTNDMGQQLEKKDFPINKKATKNLKKAKKAVAKNNTSKALKFYQRAINAEPNHPMLMDELADQYWKNGEMEKVVFWAKKMLEINPINFEAHTQLALAYQQLGKNDLAVEHINWAHLYNRNDQKIIDILQTIYADNGMVYRNYTFSPNYKIDQKNDNSILIQADKAPWQAYAACKALWQYDEKYKEQMSHFANVTSSRIEQKECLLNALISYERMKSGKNEFPELEVLGKSLRYRMIDDFILYEINLRQDPMDIYSLSDEKKKRLLRYLTSVRVLRDPTTN